MISRILQEHLGENIWVCLDYNNPKLFTINFYNDDADPYGCGERIITIDEEKLNTYIEKIKNIYELHTLVLILEEHMPKAHIKFEIISVSADVSADVDETKPSETKTDEIKSK
jgi:hypothetical protein